MSARLHLRAESPDDLNPLSALVQDMAVKAQDIGWSGSGRRLVLLGNRYRWETAASDGGTRVRCALRFDFVDQVQRRNWPVAGDAVLAVLAITREAENALLIAFSGGLMLRLTIETLDVTLEDLSGPWGAIGVPRHT